LALFIANIIKRTSPRSAERGDFCFNFQARRSKLKRFYLLALSILLIAATIACTGTTSVPSTITDDWGREVQLTSMPQRIVSHVPSITETLYALDLGDKIVGVSDYCDYPEEAKTKPKVGGYFTPNIEVIVSMNPDLVLTDGYVDEIASLESLGVTFAVIQPNNINDILKDIELLGNLTGEQKKASALITDMQSRVDKVVTAVSGTSHPRVFYVFEATDTTKPWTAGPGSFADELIRIAGGENVVAQAQGAWIQLNIEELVRSDPEIIIVDSMMGTAVISTDEIKELPGWKDTTAVKNNNIFTVDGDLVNRSGPRIVEGLEQIARIIHPELFQD
jgi:iron complex transport system substrate-binding protein